MRWLGAVNHSQIRLVAVTQALTRMELEHIEEFLAHQRDLGFERVIVFHEETVVDRRCGQQQPEKFWNKKPEVNYRPELSDEAVVELFTERCRQVSGIEVELRPSYSKGEFSGARQTEHFSDTIVELSREQDPNLWVSLLDVDELIVCPGGLKRLLAKVDDDVYQLSLAQRLMDSRWMNGKAVSMANIGKHYGLMKINRKMLLRPRMVLPDGEKCVPSVHRAEPEGRWRGRIQFPHPSRLKFHHFRGRPQHDEKYTKNYKSLNAYTKATNQAKERLNFDHVTQFTQKFAFLRAEARDIVGGLKARLRS